MITFTDLNCNQGRAVDWGDGPLLVLAGPSAGKTEVLALRISQLIEKDDLTATLTLTTSDREVSEIRKRVKQRIGGDTYRVRLNTFHDFATDLLRQHGSHLKLDSNFSILTRDEDRLSVLEEAICNLPGEVLKLPWDRINLLRLIDRLFSELYEGDGPSPSLTTTPSWLPHLFRQYCDLLLSFRCHDPGSILYFANRLFRQKPMIARAIMRLFDHVLIDRFQNTNRAQYDLIRFLAPYRNHNLFVVADENQAMNPWNGASHQRFVDLRRDYELKIIQLPGNYHCPSEVVTCANQLTGFNKGYDVRVHGIESVRGIPTSGVNVVRYMVLENLQQEAEFIGRDIYERRLSPEDCVMLARTNRLIRKIATKIKHTGYEAFVNRQKNDFESPSLGVLMEVLRLANSRHDRVVLQRLCQRWERLTRMVMDPHAVGSVAALVGGDFLRAWVDSVSAEETQREKLLDEIRSSLIDSVEFPEIIDSFLDGGWRFWGDDNSNDTLQEEIEIWRSLHREALESCGPKVTLNNYLQHLDSVSRPPQPIPNAIQCMTTEQSSGLRLKHIYLVGMVQKEFPSSQALHIGQDSPEMQKERRDFFTVITRVQETLTLTRAQEYHGHQREASQFLSEMGLYEIEGHTRPEVHALQEVMEADEKAMAGTES